jgi:hypothetical protein
MDNNNMKKQFNNFVEIERMLQFLDIQEVTTERQKKNGTREFELPIKDSWNGKKIRVASFASGYVRNQNSASSNYQLNKTKKNYEKTFSNGYEWWATERILIPNEQDRLAYLISYCLKNYYIKNANQVADGDYIPKWKYESDLEESRQRKEEIRDHFLSKEPEVKVIVNGHRYNVSEWFK